MEHTFYFMKTTYFLCMRGVKLNYTRCKLLPDVDTLVPLSTTRGRVRLVATLDFCCDEYHNPRYREKVCT